MTSKIKTEPISVRDFLRNFASLVADTSFKQYVIMKHNKPIGVFTPWEAQKKELKQGYPGIFWDELKKARFAGDPHLTDKIDEIVYGIGRNSVPD
ncbi:hypothetical protein HY733_00660 [Candidatus Uhrbacteria bacterium]|nr:hypothetical protein [Candidatus Uhrbacteria bacterium]